MTTRLSLFFIFLSLSPFITSCAGVRPPDLGVKNGKLAVCPSSPNCVSSQSPDKEHAVEPLTFTTSAPRAMADLKKLILEMKRTRIADEYDSYLHAEFTSAIWRFVDDVEFYFEDTAKTIQVRSASRLGYSDFGVNRKRVEEIRKRWNQLPK
jgi:uncharacterized protein (DUF1499 family)